MIDWEGVKDNILVVTWLVVSLSDIENSGRGASVLFLLLARSGEGGIGSEMFSLDVLILSCCGYPNGDVYY